MASTAPVKASDIASGRDKKMADKFSAAPQV
jgi:hypothetical protein